MTERLLNVSEIFSNLEPEKVYMEMENCLLLMIDQIIKELAEKYMPNIWYFLPKKVKTEVVIMARDSCPQFLTGFISDMQFNIDQILDITEMTVAACEANKSLMSSVFKDLCCK